MYVWLSGEEMVRYRMSIGAEEKEFRLFDLSSTLISEIILVEHRKK